MSKTFYKDPDAELDYSIDWTEWLDEDTISSSSWEVPTGVTEVSDSNTTEVTTIWVSGGTVGTLYTLVNTIVTAGGRTDDRTIQIVIVEK